MADNEMDYGQAPVKYSMLASYTDTASSRSLWTFGIQAFGNILIGVWSFDIYFRTLDVNSCAHSLRESLYPQGCLYLVSGILDILSCFFFRSVLRHSNRISRALDPHWENEKRRRSRYVIDDKENEPSMESESSEDEEIAIERSLINGLLSTQTTETMTDNAMLACCGTCTNGILWVISCCFSLFVLSVLLNTNCKEQDDTVRNLINSTEKLLGVVLALTLLRILSLSFVKYVYCAMFDVMHGHHRLIKHVHNRAINRFWDTEKRHRREQYQKAIRESQTKDSLL
ncbi:hypothetical protein AAMO2058_000650100 [Amorphochlora amoebiformis]